MYNRYDLMGNTVHPNEHVSPGNFAYLEVSLIVLKHDIS